jgi:citrate lyase subunit beta/citryl-CoA lyase
MTARSFLFVPGNRSDRFDKALDSGAGAVVLDLEDSVAPADKAEARETVRQWLRPNKPVYVRINGADTAWFDADATLLRLPGVIGMVLPKAETAAQIAAVAAHAGAGLRIVPIIETALGLWNAEAIARAPLVERLAFGSVDFQLDCGIDGEGDELLLARSQLVQVSRVTGLAAPIDGVTVDLFDEALLEADVARSRKLGFGAKLCVHPRQVARINAGLAPQPAEIRWAEQILAAVNHADSNAIRLDGKLVDRPIIERARAILASVAT